MVTPRSYHHGNLREAALAAARDTVVQQGHDAVSMRELALQLQVSPAALYRHFRDRSALLGAVANGVHEELLLQLQQTMATHAGAPGEAVGEALRGFLVFTEQQPGLFVMMYDDEVINAPDAEAQLPALAETYRLLLQLLRQALPEVDVKEARLRLIALWSTFFGYASVRSHGMLKSYMLRSLTAPQIEKAVLNAALAVALAPR